MPQKIIIDTDPGIDDAMAILLAFQSPELEVVGLTSIFGNVHTDLGTQNALRLAELAGRPHLPVAPEPICRWWFRWITWPILCTARTVWATSICPRRRAAPSTNPPPNSLLKR